MTRRPRTKPLNADQDEAALPRGGGDWRLSQVATGEDGLVTWVTLIAIVVMLVLISLLGNIGQVVTQKIETQNAADSVAYSGTVWMARGMNSITAGNHLIGELMALYTLHHAIGAKYLDEHYSDQDENSSPLRSVDMWLDVSYYAAKIATAIFGPGPVEDAYDEVKKDPVADEDSADFEAKRQVKELLTGVFFIHAVGGVLEDVIFTFPAGQAICEACVALEYKLYAEYLVLNLFEEIALNLSPTKQYVIPQVMTALKGYTQLVTVAMPAAAHDIGQDIGRRTHTRGSLAGPALPVEIETTDEVDRSQLMRASYPWVVHGRNHIVTVLRLGATMSGAGGYYVKWTNYYSHTLCEEFRDERDFELYVLHGLNPPDVDKGHESWTTRDGSRDAESLFCWLGVARQEEPPVVFVTPIYRQENPDGVLCVSQAMLYNANPQIRYGVGHVETDAVLRLSPPSDLIRLMDTLMFKYSFYMSDVSTEPMFPKYNGWQRQPQVGWDTLAWTGYAPEYPTDEDGINHSPLITLNWQAKLTPVTPNPVRDAAYAQLRVTDPKAAEIIRRRVDLPNRDLQELMNH